MLGIKASQNADTYDKRRTRCWLSNVRVSVQAANLKYDLRLKFCSGAAAWVFWGKFFHERISHELQVINGKEQLKEWGRLQIITHTSEAGSGLWIQVAPPSLLSALLKHLLVLALSWSNWEITINSYILLCKAEDVLQYLAVVYQNCWQFADEVAGC